MDLVLPAFGLLGDQVAFEGDPASAAGLVTVNLTTQTVVALEAARGLRGQGHGTLVLFSSIAGVRGRRANYVYGATKAGLDALGSGLDAALRGSGARVLVVRPGFVVGRMTAGMPEAPLSSTPGEVGHAVADGGARRSARGLGSPPAALARLGGPPDTDRPVGAGPALRPSGALAPRSGLGRPVRRHARVTVEPEPPGVRRAVTARSGDPHARAGPDPRLGRRRPRVTHWLGGSGPGRGAQRSAPLSALARASAWASRAGPRPRSRSVLAAGRRSRATSRPSTTSPARSRTAVACPRPPADDVGAPVHAVGEVDVEVAGLAEHDLVARGRAAEGVRARVGSPSYASTSVSRTPTRPPARSTTRTQPSSSGATSSEVRAKNARPSRRMARCDQTGPRATCGG